MSGRLTWIGHATVVIETGEVRIVTDPVLRTRVAHLVRRVPAGEVGEVDVVLISHLHRDHLDLPTLRRIGSRPTIVAPAGAGRPLRALPNQVIELGRGAELSMGDVRITAVRAVHEGRRTPMGPVSPAAGFVIETGRQRIYFAGDTELFDEMRDLAPVDVALLPVWGWGTTLGPGHMDPDQAAEATALLHPDVAVPIHWGTFLPAGHGRRDDLLRDPPERFAARVAELAPSTRVEILRPGEVLELGRPPLRTIP